MSVLFGRVLIAVQFRQQFQQRLERYGLHHVTVEPSLFALVTVVLLSPSRQRYDDWLVYRPIASNGATNFVAIHLRQSDVQQDYVEIKSIDCFQSRQSISRALDPVAAQFK